MVRAQGHLSGLEKIACLILLAVVIVFSVTNTVIWTRIDTRPPRWDESGYLTMSLKYEECLTSAGAVGFFRCLLTLYPTRPPLVPALAVPSYLLLGRSPDSALLVNSLAFVLLILAVYGIGARWASPWCGLLAAFFVSTYPSVFGLSRVFLLELVDTALVAASLYALARTEGFSDRRACLTFGVVVGLGLLCRIFFPLFVIGPLGVYTWCTWKASRQNIGSPQSAKSQWLVNGGLALVACAFITAPWYLINFAQVVQRSLSAAYGKEAIGYGPSDPLTLQAMLKYFIILMNVHTTPLGMAIFLLAAVTLWAKRSSLLPEGPRGVLNPPYGLLFLLSSVFLPLMIFSTGRSQDPKNLAPILPAIGAVSAWGLLALKPSLLKKALIGSAILASLFQFWVGTYGAQSLPQELGLHVGWRLPAPLIYRQATTIPEEAFHNLPMRENWRITEILFRMTAGSIDPSGMLVMARPTVVGIIPNYPLFNKNNFEYFAALGGLPVRVEQIGRWTGKGDFGTELLGVDFAVVKTGDPGPAWINRYNADMIRFLRSPESRFAEIPPRLPLPDGSEAVLYGAKEAVMTNEFPRIQFLTPVNFDEGLELMGYDLEAKEPGAWGRPISLTFYWKARRQVLTDYRVLVHVMDAAGSRIVANWDHEPARGRYPSSFWMPETVILDRGLYFLPDNLPPASYSIWVGLYILATWQPAGVVHASPKIVLNDARTKAAIGTIDIMR